MLKLLLVLINTLLLLFITYPHLSRLFSSGTSGPDKEIPVDGYQYGDGPVALKDADVYDYTDVFGNLGWRNLIGSKESVVQGVRKTYEPSFSLKSS